MTVVFTSTFGLDPAMRTEASGSKIAEEWYSRAMVELCSPAFDQRLPAGASGSYIAGVPTGPDANDMANGISAKFAVWPVAVA
jgi:hypothetical protein